MPFTVTIPIFCKSTRTQIYVDFKGDFQAGLHPRRTSEHNKSDHKRPTAVGQQASDEQKQRFPGAGVLLVDK